MTEKGGRRALSLASVLGLIALALMAWSVLSPTVLPVMVAMSVGQLIGTLSLLIYVVVVVLDLRGRAGRTPPEPPEDRS